MYGRSNLALRLAKRVKLKNRIMPKVKIRVILFTSRSTFYPEPPVCEPVN